MTYKPQTNEVTHDLLKKLWKELKRINDHLTLVTGTSDPPNEEKD